MIFLLYIFLTFLTLLAIRKLHSANMSAAKKFKKYNGRWQEVPPDEVDESTTSMEVRTIMVRHHIPQPPPGWVAVTPAGIRHDQPMQIQLQAPPVEPAQPEEPLPLISTEDLQENLPVASLEDTEDKEAQEDDELQQLQDIEVITSIRKLRECLLQKKGVWETICLLLTTSRIHSTDAKQDPSFPVPTTFDWLFLGLMLLFTIISTLTSKRKNHVMLILCLLTTLGLIPGSPMSVTPDTLQLTSEARITTLNLPSNFTIHVNSFQDGPIILVEGEIPTKAYYPTTTIVDFHYLATDLHNLKRFSQDLINQHDEHFSLHL